MKKRKEQIINYNDIKEIEYQINNKDKINKKRKIIKNLKIGSKICTATAPYVLTTGIITGIFSWGYSSYSTLFQDEEYIHPTQKTEFDSKENITYEDPTYINQPIHVYCYSKWQKDEKDLYSRNVKIFTLNNNSIDRIIQLLENDVINQNLKLEDVEDILGSPISEKTEKKNNLTEEEINEQPFIKSIIYDYNKDELIYYKKTIETIEKDIVPILLYITLVTFGISVTAHIRGDILRYNIHDDIEKIKDDYKPLNEEEIKQLRKKPETKNKK